MEYDHVVFRQFPGQARHIPFNSTNLEKQALLPEAAEVIVVRTWNSNVEKHQTFIGESADLVTR